MLGIFLAMGWQSHPDLHVAASASSPLIFTKLSSAQLQIDALGGQVADTLLTEAEAPDALHREH